MFVGDFRCGESVQSAYMPGKSNVHHWSGPELSSLERGGWVTDAFPPPFPHGALGCQLSAVIFTIVCQNPNNFSLLLFLYDAAKILWLKKIKILFPQSPVREMFSKLGGGGGREGGGNIFAESIVSIHPACGRSSQGNCLPSLERGGPRPPSLPTGGAGHPSL